MNHEIVKRHLLDLSRVYPLQVDEQYRYFIVCGFRLPPGYNMSTTDVWVDIPKDYPESPPGVGRARVYVPKGLKFKGRTPSYYHKWKLRGPSGWAWLCYSRIKWNPSKDSLITFFEILRAHLTDNK